MNSMIIDAHVHLPCYRDNLLTLEDKKQCLLDDLSAAGISSAIVISDSTTSSVLGTPRDCVELFADTSNIYVMAGISPLIDFKERLTQTRAYLRDKSIVAVKLYPGHEAYYMDDPRLIPVYELCEEYDVPLAVHTGWENAHFNRPHYFDRLAHDHPALRMVICHMCWPEIEQCYAATSAYPNIYYDVSGLAYETAVLDHTINALSTIAEKHAERVIFGSDYGACSIKAHIHMINALSIDESKKRMILADNAIKAYKL